MKRTFGAIVVLWLVGALVMHVFLKSLNWFDRPVVASSVMVEESQCIQMGEEMLKDEVVKEKIEYFLSYTADPKVYTPMAPIFFDVDCRHAMIQIHHRMEDFFVLVNSEGIAPVVTKYSWILYDESGNVMTYRALGMSKWEDKVGYYAYANGRILYMAVQNAQVIYGSMDSSPVLASLPEEFLNPGNDFLDYFLFEKQLPDIEGADSVSWTGWQMIEDGKIWTNVVYFQFQYFKAGELIQVRTYFFNHNQDGYGWKEEVYGDYRNFAPVSLLPDGAVVEACKEGQTYQFEIKTWEFVDPKLTDKTC